MISETLPLNEWPSTELKCLLVDIETADMVYKMKAKHEFASTANFISVVKSAIKDAEEREAKLPFE